MPLPADFVRTLERLYLLARKHMTREDQGSRRSPRRGASIEFHDYRHYTPGDEVRYIDWNVFARHGSLFVKEFSAEENVHVTLLLDTSLSMSFGDPPKFDAAKEIIAALGYIGLVSYDTVSFHTFAEKVRPGRSLMRGKPMVFEFLKVLDEVHTAGKTDLRASLGHPLPSLKGRSIIILVTDFYDSAYADALRRLRAQRHQVNVVHVVSGHEMEPTLKGRQVLVDLETSARRDIHVTPALLERYRRRFRAYCGELERFCQSSEIRYARVRSDDSLEDRVMEILRKGGILDLR